MKYERLEKRATGLAAILICISFGVLGIYLFFKYGFSILLPFFIGWAVAMAIAPLAGKLSGKDEKRQRIISVMLFLFLVLVAVLLIILIFDRLMSEAQRLLERLAKDSEDLYELIGNALDFAQSITEHIPFFDGLGFGEDAYTVRDKIDAFVGKIIGDAAEDLGARLPVWLGAFAGAIPSFMLFVIVTLISGFYFSVDLLRIHSSIKKSLPTSVSERLTIFRRGITGTALKYLRAYFLLLLMTFGELFIGFSILGIDYALLLAALIAVIDILPVFGVGGIVVPWGVIQLISGNYYLGIGLLIIYACVTVIRQLAEPKIVGGSLGIHPLITLFAIYAGFKLFGFFGMIIGPIFAVVIKSIFADKTASG